MSITDAPTTTISENPRLWTIAIGAAARRRQARSVAVTSMAERHGGGGDRSLLRAGRLFSRSIYLLPLVRCGRCGGVIWGGGGAAMARAALRRALPKAGPHP
jgi:hypothetical protein